MEGNRIRHCHLLTPPRNVGSTPSPKAELLPSHAVDFALLPVKAVLRASSRPPLHTPWGKQCCPHLAQHLSPGFPTALGKPGASQGFQARAHRQALPQAEAGRPPSNSPFLSCRPCLTTQQQAHTHCRRPCVQAPPHEGLLIVLVQSKDRERKREWLSVQPLHSTDGESTAYEHQG